MSPEQARKLCDQHPKVKIAEKRTTPLDKEMELSKQGQALGQIALALRIRELT